MTIDLKGDSSILLPYKRRKMPAGEVDYMEAISDDFLKTVVFLCVKEKDAIIPKATGFCVRTLPLWARESRAPLESFVLVEESLP